MPSESAAETYFGSGSAISNLAIGALRGAASSVRFRPIANIRFGCFAQSKIGRADDKKGGPALVCCRAAIELTTPRGVGGGAARVRLSAGEGLEQPPMDYESPRALIIRMNPYRG